MLLNILTIEHKLEIEIEIEGSPVLIPYHPEGEDSYVENLKVFLIKKDNRLEITDFIEKDRLNEFSVMLLRQAALEEEEGRACCREQNEFERNFWRLVL